VGETFCPFLSYQEWKEPVTNLPEDRLLTQYLLRALPEEETERLDELSVASDDFAARLSSAENDLVDTYVRGELPPEESARFRSAYLSSPKRRDKVRFAETFLSFQQRVAAGPVVIPTVAAQPEKRESAWARLSRWFRGVRSGTSRASTARFAPQWGLAGAALLLLLASGYLLNTNLRLRQQVSRSESARAALAQHEKDLQNQFATKTAGASANTEAHTAPSIDRLKVSAFVLIPSLRGSGALPIVSWSAATDLVVLKLELESTGFSTHRVAIEDSATRQTAWQSGDLKPQSEGDKQVLAFAFRPSLLKSANYLVQLSGVRDDGTTELLSIYPFRGVVK
jgi:hypothetical protein